MMITDFRLKVFLCTAQELSFTRAAERLLITQPAVSKQIGELERQLSTTLFLRQGNRITLTAEGERLREYAQRILGMYERLNEAFAQGDEVLEGELSLGASTTIAQYVLPELLARFRTRYPNIALTLRSDNSQNIEEQIRSQELSLGLIESPAHGALLRYDHFLRDELVLVTASGNPFAREEITPEELRTLPLIIRESGSGTLEVWTKALAEHRISTKELNIEMRLGSSESLKRYLQASETFAFISIRAVNEELLRGELRVVEIKGVNLERNFSFVRNHGSESHLQELFRRFCLSETSRILG